MQVLSLEVRRTEELVHAVQWRRSMSTQERQICEAMQTDTLSVSIRFWRFWRFLYFLAISTSLLIDAAAASVAVCKLQCSLPSAAVFPVLSVLSIRVSKRPSFSADRFAKNNYEQL